MKRFIEILAKKPPTPLGRWCCVGDHPLCRSWEWKEANKRFREELRKSGTDPYETVRRDHETVPYELVDW
jgi:hypothetical protein